VLVTPVEAQILAVDVAHLVQRAMKGVQAGRLVVETYVAQRDVPDLCPCSLGESGVGNSRHAKERYNQ
jgi:hypothetical protein